MKDDETSPDGLSQTRMMEALPQASWVHLPVHGEVSSRFPQGSLLFSDNDSQRLTAEQIMTLAPCGLWMACSSCCCECLSDWSRSRGRVSKGFHTGRIAELGFDRVGSSGDVLYSVHEEAL